MKKTIENFSQALAINATQLKEVKGGTDNKIPSDDWIWQWGI